MQKITDYIIKSRFVYNTLPYQKRRILPQQTLGDLPFARESRYDTYYRDKLPSATVTPYYDQFAPFNLKQFMREADWKTAFSVLILFAAVAAVTLLIGYGLNPVG